MAGTEAGLRCRKGMYQRGNVARTLGDWHLLERDGRAWHL